MWNKVFKSPLYSCVLWDQLLNRYMTWVVFDFIPNFLCFQILIFFYANQFLVAISSRSTLTSLSCRGLVTFRTTVKWSIYHPINWPLAKRVGNCIRISAAKALGIVWRNRTSKRKNHHYNCGCLCSQVCCNCSNAVFLLVPASCPSKRSQVPLRYWFGPSFPLESFWIWEHFSALGV